MYRVPCANFAASFFGGNVLGLHCCSGFFLVAVSEEYSLVAVGRLLIGVAFLVAEHGL